MKNSTATIIKETENGARLVKYNNRYYTVFGRMFAVAGNHIDSKWENVCNISKKYKFQNFNTLSAMYLDK